MPSLVGSEMCIRDSPFGQRARSRQPSANEFTAGVLRAFAVDGTLTRDTERTRLARPDVMPTHFDLQPAVAARRAASAGSPLLLGQWNTPPVIRADVR